MPSVAKLEATADQVTAAEMIREAKRALKDGMPDLAARTYRDILKRYPKNAQAAQALAKITARPPVLPKGNDGPTRARLMDVGQANAVGDSAAVVRLCRTLIDAYFGSAALHLVLGVALGKTGALKDAVRHLQIAEDLRPDYAESAYNLGVVYQELGLPAEAIGAYGRALEVDPDRADAWNNIGAVMMEAGDVPAALQAFDKAVTADPDMVEAWNNRGHMRQNLGDFEGAIADYQQVLARDPAHVNVYFNIAHAMKLIGQKEASKTCLWQVLKLDPNLGTAARELALIVKGQEAEDLAPVVEALLAPRQSPETRMHAGYAAAYLAMEAGEDAQAVAHLDRAGGIAQVLKNYRIEHDRKLFETLKTAFKGPVPQAESTPGPVPIFIVGMPRSGTSLTEEILARHSAVCAAGELEYLRRAVAKSGVLDAPMTTAHRDYIRAAYLEALGNHQTADAAYVTDKMPINFRFVGHIAAALPEAKIVHLRRQPEAVCWSNFKLHFPAEGMAFSSTQADIAAYFRLYDDMMAFWDDTFPGRVTHVQYEDLTEAPEATVKSLVAAMGLEWEDGLTDVAASGRSVRTASALQVKQEIYQGSSEAWRRYEPWLGPMLDGLRGSATQS